MASIKELLELRTRIKRKKPSFIRQDFGKKKRIDKKWRKPTGLHSKIRGHFSGRAKSVSQGYRSPKKVRGLHKSGLPLFIVKSIGDLKRLDPKKTCLIISSSFGNKKRIVILKKAKEDGFIISNIKNPEEYIKKVENELRLRGKLKKEDKGEKKEAKAEKLADKLSEEQKKKIEKEEKDKVLITKKV